MIHFEIKTIINRQNNPTIDYADLAKQIAPYVEQGRGRGWIAQNSNLTERVARTAISYLKSDAMQETQKSAEISPESTEKAPKSAKTEKLDKTEKSEKKKAPRLHKVHKDYFDLPRGQVHRFLITSAQDDTPINEQFFKSLCTYAELLQAPLLVCGFTYQKGLFEDHAVATAAYAPELAPYMIHNQLQITPDLLLVSDANVLPTTANPLSGWHDVNNGNHVIVPSARIAFESIPRLQNDPPRYIASTGCVTIPSYTPRAAGRKAIHKHTYGATLVEIDSDGEVFIHPIFAAEDGSFQHLDRIIDGDECTLGNPVDVMVLGDIHLDQIDPIVAMTAIGYDAMQKKVVTDACLRGQLRPKNLVLHDLIDGLHFNPHNRNDVHERARIRASSPSTVEDEVIRSANFVNEITFDGCFTHVIQSNHDNFLARYLQDKDGALDPVNAYYWHRLNYVWHDEIRKGNGDFFNVVHEALRISGMQDHVNFVAYGEDLRINGIDYSLHGDRGTGGSKGGETQFSRLAFKNTTAHGHRSWIFGKGFGAGTFSRLYMHYNKGLTRSCHSCVVGFSNGQQGLITINPDGRYQATGDITNRSQRAA